MNKDLDTGRAVRWTRASDAFDTITEASYYGADFRCFLVENSEALEAAEKLASLIREHQQKRGGGGA